MTHFDNSSTRYVLTALAGLALAAAAASCTDAAASAPAETAAKATQIDTITATPRSIATTETATGSVVADHSAPVAADASGKVIAVYVQRGDKVKAGQPLARLDVRAAALGASEAHAQLSAARSDAKLAQIECERSRTLFAKGVISQAELDHETTRCATTAGSVAAARARAGMASKAVGDGLIRAPFAGVISERLIEVGEYVRADSKIATLVDADPLRIELAVPESLLGSMTLGREIPFTTLSRPGQTFRARITRLAAQLDTASRSLDIEAEVIDGEGLVPGMFVAAEVVTGERELPVIPRTALRAHGTSWRALIVHEGTLEERIVQLATGDTGTGDTVAITEGIAAGDTLANPLTDKLSDGMRVQ